MSALIDGVTVANAALAEVGLPQIAVKVADPVIAGRYSITAPEDGPLIRRALLLGLMAVHGPLFVVRCMDCRYAASRTVPCVPAREALRGATCGRLS